MHLIFARLLLNLPRQAFPAAHVQQLFDALGLVSSLPLFILGERI